jgi:hypothetical protein
VKWPHVQRFLGRRRILRAGAALILFFLAAACGGGSGEPAPAADTFSQGVVMAASHVKIDTTLSSISLTAWNAEHTSLMLLWVPLARYFEGESVEMNADNLYGADPQRATLLVLQAADIQTLTHLTVDEAIAQSSGAWISAEGRLTVEAASVAADGAVRFAVANAVMRPLDRTSGLIDREGDDASFTTTMSGTVNEGAIYGPFIVSAAPLSGGLGTKVTLRGFNFSAETEVRFKGCGRFLLPATQPSGDALEVSVIAYCEDSSITLVDNSVQQQGWIPVFVFDERSELSVLPLPHPEEDLLKVVHDPTSDLLYMLFAPGAEIDVYSIGAKQFLPSKPLPTPADTFDLALDGTLLTAKGKVLTNVAVDGSIAGQTTILLGDSISDIASGPGPRVLVVNTYEHTFEMDVCAWDPAAMTVVCPPELKPHVFMSYVRQIAMRRDRKTAAVHSREYAIAVYRLEDDGSMQMASEDSLNCASSVEPHALRDEIWCGAHVWNADLVEIKSLSASPAYPSPGGARYYAFDACAIDIRADDDQGERLSYASCRNEEDRSESLFARSFAISDDDRFLTVIWNEKIRQVDLGLVNAYLEGR